MKIAESVLNSFVITSTWLADWAWGLPLIVLTVVIHVLGLGLLRQKVVQSYNCFTHRRHQTAVFALVLGSTTLLATVLHEIEAFLWAIAYRLLSALPDRRSAVLYSLNAITSYGHTGLSLEERWRLMGAMESLNGWLLFGLTTAFLFAVIDKFGRAESQLENREPRLFGISKFAWARNPLLKRLLVRNPHFTCNPGPRPFWGIASDKACYRQQPWERNRVEVADAVWSRWIPRGVWWNTPLPWECCRLFHVRVTCATPRLSIYQRGVCDSNRLDVLTGRACD